MKKIILIGYLVLLSNCVWAQEGRVLPYASNGYYTTDSSGCMPQSVPTSDDDDSDNDDDGDDDSSDSSNGQTSQSSSASDCVGNTYGSGGNVIRSVPRGAVGWGVERR